MDVDGNLRIAYTRLGDDVLADLDRKLATFDALFMRQRKDL